jgi:hypothetical protein
MSYSQRAKNAPTAKVTSKSSQAADFSGNPVSFTGKAWVFTARIGYGTVMKHTGSLGLEETHIKHTHAHTHIYNYIYKIEHPSSFLFV